MTPSINGYLEPSERTRPEERDDPPFVVQLGVLILCIAVLALLTAPIWLP